MAFQSIPGHTPGALNFMIPVRHKGKEYRLMMGGRQGHPTGVAAARGYLTGTERAYRLIQRYGIEGTFLTHHTSDGSTVNMQAMERAGTRDPNPFLIGHERALRAAAIWRGCAAAWLATRDATADVLVWRVTSLAFSDLTPFSNTVSAQLMTGWGPTDPDPDWRGLAGQVVTFSVDRSGAACAAVTDSQGVATCELPSRLLPQQQVTATYEGTADAQWVNLPSTKSSVVGTP